MLRQKLLRLARDHGGETSPFLLVASILLIVLLPFLAARRVFVDENNFGENVHQLSTVRDIIWATSSEVQWNQRLVRPGRASEPEVIAVYVNTAHNASVWLANILIKHLLLRNDMSCDLQFYFVNDSMKWPVPEIYVRAALVLNISTLYNRGNCIDIYSKHGLRPNHDLANLAILFAGSSNLEVALNCQTGRSLNTNYNPLRYFIRSLEESMLIDNHPQPWHEISTRGINTIAFSSIPFYAPDSTEGIDVEKDGVLSENAIFVFRHVVWFIRMILALNRLEEKLHHATFGYIPVSAFYFVSFDIAQLSIFLSMASVVSTAYAIHKRAEPLLAPARAMLLMFLMSPIASFMHLYTGLPGLTLTTLLFAGLIVRMPVLSAWLGANVAALAMMVGMGPSVGILGGAGVALQLFFLHPMCSRISLLCFGVIVSWVVYFYFIWYLEFPMWSTNNISSIFVSVFLYPNAVWVSSRLMQISEK